MTEAFNNVGILAAAVVRSSGERPLIYVLSALLAVSACGFTPMYAQNDAGADVAAYYSDIFIENLKDRDGQYLRNALIDRIYVDGRVARRRSAATPGRKK